MQPATDLEPRGRPRIISDEDGIEVAREIKGAMDKRAVIRRLAVQWHCSETTIRDVYRRNFPCPIRERKRQALERAVNLIKRNIDQFNAIDAAEAAVLSEHLLTIAAEL